MSECECVMCMCKCSRVFVSAHFPVSYILFIDYITFKIERKKKKKEPAAWKFYFLQLPSLLPWFRHLPPFKLLERLSEKGGISSAATHCSLTPVPPKLCNCPALSPSECHSHLAWKKPPTVQ